MHGLRPIQFYALPGAELVPSQDPVGGAAVDYQDCFPTATNLESSHDDVQLILSDDPCHHCFEPISLGYFAVVETCCSSLSPPSSMNQRTCNER